MRLGELLRSRTAGRRRAPEASSAATGSVAGARPDVSVDGRGSPGPGRELRWIDVSRIHPGPYQPRQVREDDPEMAALVDSIREHGVLQPVVVRETADGFELVAGERRWRAAQRAGLEAVPAMVQAVDDRTAAQWALIENVQRAQLHFFEEAEGYRRLLEEFGMTQEELARRLGRSQSAVANKVRLLKLPAEVRAWVVEHGLSERHARALLRVQAPERQLAAAREMVVRGLSAEQGERLMERLEDGRLRPRRRVRGSYGDARIFVNGLRQVVAKARQAGVLGQLEEQEGPEGWTFVIRLSRRAGPRVER